MIRKILILVTFISPLVLTATTSLSGNSFDLRKDFRNVRSVLLKGSFEVLLDIEKSIPPNNQLGPDQELPTVKFGGFGGLLGGPLGAFKCQMQGLVYDGETLINGKKHDQYRLKYLAAPGDDDSFCEVLIYHPILKKEVSVFLTPQP